METTAEVFATIRDTSLTCKARCLKLYPSITLSILPGRSTSRSARYKKGKSLIYHVKNSSFGVQASTEVEAWKQMLDLITAYHKTLLHLIGGPPIIWMIPAMLGRFKPIKLQ